MKKMYIYDKNSSTPIGELVCYCKELPSTDFKHINRKVVYTVKNINVKTKEKMNCDC